MIPFFRKKSNKVNTVINTLKTDIHSHVIPGIDDGSKSMDESIFLIKELKKLGYKKLITTPHIMDKAYNNSKESILNNLEKLKNECKKENIDILLEAAAEYYVDDGFMKLIEKDELLAIDDEYILFETSYIHRPVDLESVIYNITTLGYKPLFAHPERYKYIKDPEKEFSELKAHGALFQVNLNSFVGYYGKQAKKHAHVLHENSMINFLGSDVHNKSHISSLETAFKDTIYNEIVSNNNILNSTI
ncbi:MAG: capsular biosynthesis protein [Sulfurovum sp.]|nr:capsular biosynthesis protein [Sulfurovum sp.]